MTTLVLLKYNNYYNRIVKWENTVYNYRGYQVALDVAGVNFIPNDFINTEVIVNMQTYGVDPDYLLVIDENENILSRWFIISTTRTTAGQFRLELHRDLVVDYYDHILYADMFIEKATPKSIRDPAIYNSEDMTFNQIKQKEQLLYDETKCPWIVGYVPRDSFKTDTTVTVSALLAGTADIEVNNLSEYQFIRYRDSIISGQINNPTIKIGVTYWIAQGTLNYYYANSIKLDQDGNYIGLQSGSGQTSLAGYYWKEERILDSPVFSPVNRFTDSYARTVASRMPELSDEFKNLSDYVETGGISDAEYQQLLKDNGKIIYEKSSNKYFKISIEGNPSSSSTTIPIPWNSSLGVNMADRVVKDFDGHILSGPVSPDTNSPFSFTSETAFQVLKIEPVEVNLSVRVPAERYQVSESPYDLFCMPYSDSLTIKKNGAVYVEKTNKSAAITLALQIMAQVGTGNIYDIQLLPYCPVRYCIRDNGDFDVGTADYTDIKSGDETVGVLLWATTDNFTFNISVPISEKQDVIDKKVTSQTEFIRLVSPNYSNSFEFNPLMNEGLDYVNVLCHYKPFNPYIKIQPNFKGLYGNAFNDARGLICNGDFSLAQITSAWANYELQNKNYQAVFNREILNMLVTNAVQKEREIWGVVAGTVGAATSGATAGLMVGGPAGAAVGAVTGVSSLAAGVRDIQLNNQLRSEALDYKHDMFGYQLLNIQALPYGLAKTSAISPDNKLVPFVEFYSCTDAEKQALENKITYNGSTIMMIGKIADYKRDSRSYIKGRLIRLEGFPEDYHVVNALADELYKGVFI